MADTAKDEIVQTPELEEDFSESFEDESIALHTDFAFSELLKTHQRIKPSLFGSIVSLEKGFSKVNLLTTNDMVIDELGLVHSGFIFSSADYAAATAVNEENVVISGAALVF